MHLSFSALYFFIGTALCQGGPLQICRFEVCADLAQDTPRWVVEDALTRGGTTIGDNVLITSVYKGTNRCEFGARTSCPCAQGTLGIPFGLGGTKYKYATDNGIDCNVQIDC